MKIYRFSFQAPLTPEQEECLYAGFSAFYYDVEDKFAEGIKKAEGNLYQLVSSTVKRVTNIDGAEMSLTRLKMARDNLEVYINWDNIGPGMYEFKLAVEFFNELLNAGPIKANVGDKLDKSLIKLFNDKICPKIGIKKEDVEITTEVKSYE